MTLARCKLCAKEKNKITCHKFSAKGHSSFATIFDMLEFVISKFIDTKIFSVDDHACRKCLNALKACVNFIEQCISVVSRDLVKREDVSIETEPLNKPKVDEETVFVDAKLESTGEIQNVNEYFDEHNVSDNEENDEFVQCYMCSQQYLSKELLKEHIDKEHVIKSAKVVVNKKRDRKKTSLNCYMCQEKFKTNRTLKEHLVSIHSFTGFNCNKCGKVFKTQIKFEEHIEKNKNKVSCFYKCERCNKEFKNSVDYNKHIEKTKDAPSCDFETCIVCSKKFSKEDFKEHLTVHPKKICEVCGEGFSNLGAFFRHKISHNEPNQAICPVCGKGFNHSHKLSTHLKYTHEYGEKKFSCTRCNKKFFTNQSLTLHLKRHDNIKDIPCPQCDKMFLSKTLLQTHFKAVHLNLRPHSCPQCGRKFARGQHLQKHLETHMKYKARGGNADGVYNITIDNPGLPGKCHHCGRVFKNLNHLKQHVRTVHVRIRRFKCEFCDMKFICKHTQMKHQEKHKDPCYEFRCKICYKKNKSQDELSEHMKKHTKLPFQCKLCGEEFGRSYLLENHMLSKHPDNNLHKPQEIMDEALQNVVFIDHTENSSNDVKQE